MFWRRFAKRTSDSPEQIEQERKDRAVLKDRIVSLLNAQPYAQFTLRHLEQCLRPHSLAAISLALAELQNAGVVDRIIRVESPESHGGIEDFRSMSEIKEEIHDWRTQQTIRVDPSMVSFVFQAHTANDLANA